MADMLILDLDGVGEADYAKVNAELGIDVDTGAGDWPAGLVSHIAGVDDSGHGYVVEVWESQQAQADFMGSRLGAAMAAAGITAVPQMTWARVMGHRNPGL
ncbi:MAG TPA: hypothetical protein VHR85_14335 [Nocardioides sp.]|jgi:hypothetical protein|nr:hypothetical protein [Nocardioides sp.]